MAQGNDLEVNDFANEANDFTIQANGFTNQVNGFIGKGKKAVGGLYKCESCEAEYAAKTVWQKFCPTCSKERKRQVMQAKARKTA